MSNNWACPRCTLINRSTDLNCQACGGSAPPSVPNAYHGGVHVPSQQQASPVQASAPPAYAPHYVPSSSTSTSAYNPSASTTPFVAATPVPATAVPVTGAQPVTATAYSTTTNTTQSMSEDVPDNLWLCPACSWVNKKTYSECKACGQAAPRGVVSVPASSTTTPIVVSAQPVPVQAQTMPVQAQAVAATPYQPQTTAVSSTGTFASGFDTSTSTASAPAAYNPSSSYATPSQPVAAAAFSPYSSAPPTAAASYSSSAYASSSRPSQNNNSQQSNDDFVSGFSSHRFDARVLHEPSSAPSAPNYHRAQQRYPGAVGGLPSNVHSNLYYR